MTVRIRLLARVVTLIPAIAGCTSKATVTGPECRISGVSIAASQSQLTMTVGQTVDLVATVSRSGCAEVPALEWSSSDPSVASVSSAGAVTALSAGTALVTARLRGRSDSAVAQVNVRGRVLDLKLSPDSARLPVASSLQLVASLTVDPGTPTALIWSSTHPGRASVDGTGLVTAVTPGTVQIVVRPAADSTRSATATITVTPRVLGVRVSPERDTIAVAETLGLTVAVDGDSGVSQAVSWNSASPAIATVSAGGTVTGIAAGTVEITATSLADSTQAATATIIVLPRVTGLTVTPPSATLAPGSTVTLTAVVTGDPGVATTVTWSSSNPAVATVSEAGLVSAVAAGTASVTARAAADPTRSASAAITVVNPPPPPPPPSQTTDLCLSGVSNDPEGSLRAGPEPGLLVLPQCPAEVGLDLVVGGTFNLAGRSAATGQAIPVTWSLSGSAVGMSESSASEAVLVAESPGLATLTVTALGNASVKAVVRLRVLATPVSGACVALTASGPCHNGPVAVPAGQSVTLYTMAGAAPATALWPSALQTAPYALVPMFGSSVRLVAGPPGTYPVLAWLTAGTGLVGIQLQVTP